jgi:hypothetical protein
MADEVTKRKAVAEKTVSNWRSKPYTAYTAPVEKQRRLFEALNAFVAQQGGWVVSAPGNKSIRIEAPEGSALPIRLAELGYKLQFCGTGTRNTSSGFVPVDIIETKLSVR